MKKGMMIIMKLRKIIGLLIILISGVLFWMMAMLNQIGIADYHGAVSVRYSEPVLIRQEIEDIIEAMTSKNDVNIPEVTLWQKEEDILIRREERDAFVSLDLIMVAGDMSEVYPGPMAYGGYLSKEDDTGCVIDRNTADRLFGSENAVGMTIKFREKEYIIRGIMQESAGNTMMVQEEDTFSSEQNQKKYSCMELHFQDTGRGKFLAERFVLVNGFGTPAAYIDGYVYQKLSYLLIHIPLWFCALLIIIWSVRKVYSLKNSPLLILTGVLGIAVLSILLIKITNIHIYYPSSLIPNKWSDFDFWGDKIRGMVSSIGGREGVINYYKEVMLKRRLLFVVWGVVLATAAEGLLIKKVSGSYYSNCK